MALNRNVSLAKRLENINTDRDRYEYKTYRHTRHTYFFCTSTRNEIYYTMIYCPVKYLLWTIASEKKDRRLRGLVSLVYCFRSKTQGSSAVSTLPCFVAKYFMRATAEKQNIVQLYLQAFSTKSHSKTITVNMYICFVEVRLNGDDEISVNRHVGCRRITNELLTVLSDRPSEPYRDKSGPLYAFVVL